MFGFKKESAATMEPPEIPEPPAEKPKLPPREIRVRLLVTIASPKRAFLKGDELLVRAATAFRMQEAGEAVIIGGALTAEDAASAVDDHGDIEILDEKFRAIAQPNLDLLIAERDRLIAEFAAAGVPTGEHETSRQMQNARFAGERRAYERWESARKFAEEYPAVQVVGQETPPKSPAKGPAKPVNWPMKSKRIVELEAAIRQQRSELLARRHVSAVRQSVRLQAAHSRLVDALNTALQEAITAADKLVDFGAKFQSRTGCAFSAGFGPVDIPTQFAKQLRSLKGDAQRHVDAAKTAGVLDATNFPTIEDLPASPMLDSEMP